MRGNGHVSRCADVNAHGVRGNDEVLRCADVRVHAVRVGVIVQEGELVSCQGFKVVATVRVFHHGVARRRSDLTRHDSHTETHQRVTSEMLDLIPTLKHINV